MKKIRPAREVKLKMYRFMFSNLFLKIFQNALTIITKMSVKLHFGQCYSFA